MIDKRIRMTSNHQELKIRAFAVLVPKSFSIKVAYPMEKANANNKIVAHFMEDKK